MTSTTRQPEPNDSTQPTRHQPPAETLPSAHQLPPRTPLVVECRTPPGSTDCPVGARLASRRRAQIIRSVPAPERRVQEWRGVTDGLSGAIIDDATGSVTIVDDDDYV